MPSPEIVAIEERLEEVLRQMAQLGQQVGQAKSRSLNGTKWMVVVALFTFGGAIGTSYTWLHHSFASVEDQRRAEAIEQALLARMNAVEAHNVADAMQARVNADAIGKLERSQEVDRLAQAQIMATMTELRVLFERHEREMRATGSPSPQGTRPPRSGFDRGR